MTLGNVPNPGSDEAIKRGCICAVMDNARGRGCGRDVNGERLFYITAGCPVHAAAPDETGGK